ncbi:MULTISPECIES: hypothetical protein [Bacteria]|uniref:hypothetical protein n=1 Tax=Bacteria TaxID=2 RepID=UPI003C7BEFC4
MIDALLRTAVSPTPSPTPAVDPTLVTPGPVGFAVMALLVVVVVVIVWDMQRRIRRVRYREEVREELDAEERAAKDGVAEDGARATAVADEPGEDGISGRWRPDPR